MQRLLRVLKIALGILLVGIVGLAVTAIVMDKPRPTGKAGKRADALARHMMTAVDIEAWERDVGAIQWTFGDRRQHVWDRRRQLAWVRWGDYDVRLDTAGKTAIAKRAGVLLEGAEAETARQDAYRAWVNDSFWLNPIAKLFDPGAQREVVHVNGEDQLLVTWGEGGVTPGDTYLFKVSQGGLPTAWQMWVDIIPTGGLEATWEAWTPLPGGAKVATLHDGLAELRLSKVAAARDVATLLGEDPFGELSTRLGARPSSRPASQPTKTSTVAP